MYIYQTSQNPPPPYTTFIADVAGITLGAPILSFNAGLKIMGSSVGYLAHPMVLAVRDFGYHDTRCS